MGILGQTFASLFSLIIALLAPKALGAQGHRTPDVFSSLEYVQESGDVIGHEVLVQRTSVGVCVSYQEAEGAPGSVRIVPGTLRGDSLAFTIPPDSGYAAGSRRLEQVGPSRVFHGRISRNGLRGQIEGEVQPIYLPRRQRAYFPASARRLEIARTC